MALVPISDLLLGVFTGASTSKSTWELVSRRSHSLDLSMILGWLDVVVPFLAVGVFLLDTGGLIETVLLLLVTGLVGSGLDIVSVH